MSELTPKGPSDVSRLTEDQVAERINVTVNAAANMPEGMDVTKNLAVTFAVHYDDTGKMDIPETVMQIELIRAVGNLESRIVAIEKGLRDANISFPKANQV
jgi:hypothetical protein